MDLTLPDQLQLLNELDIVQKVMWDEFAPHQLNVAAIGNKTPQLHIHVVARYENDPAWPGTVWDRPTQARYDEAFKEERIARLQYLLARD